MLDSLVVLDILTLEFLISALVVVLIPGTGVIYTIATGLSVGRSASLYAALGCTLGIVPHLLASILGLAAVLHTSALAFNVVKWLGVAYLLYMAWGMWRSPVSFDHDTGVNQQGRGLKVAKTGFLINILNPKLSIFFLAFLPQFISLNVEISSSVQMLILSLSFMLMTFAVFVIYGQFAGAVRNFITQSPVIMQRLQRSFAAVFLVLGAKLASSER